MQRTHLRWLRPVALLVSGIVLTLSFTLAGCGGSDDDDDVFISPSPSPSSAFNPSPTPSPTASPSSGLTGTVTGRVLAPDGRTAVSDALIYVPSDQTRALSLRTGAGRAAPEPAITETRTDANGNFALAGVPAGDTVVKILKGQWLIKTVVSVVAGGTATVPVAQTTLPVTGAGAARIAVVVGAFDRMEDVLAKLGLGEVENGRLKQGTERFDIYGGPDFNVPGLPQSLGDTNSLVSDAAKLAQYDIVFFNCGADEGPLENAAVRQNLRNYVQNGGNLYVTDLAYDYIEQSIPEAIDFFGADGVPIGTAEESGTAEVGASDVASNADVQDDNLRNWLSARGALRPDGKVRIEGFLSGWGVINKAETGGKEWIRGLLVDEEGSRSAHNHRHGKGRSRGRQVSVGETRTLTVTAPFGAGKVLYSSYHTEPSEEQSSELRPQEQILAYLVFEL
ncbi:MAG: hypothetical protein H7145_14030 [Akkermansiaceae bacterium]|nr:hypothetical protein [Armatimonadota bacterium]